jgi:hypothetical protein
MHHFRITHTLKAPHCLLRNVSSDSKLSHFVTDCTLNARLSQTVNYSPQTYG